MKANPNTTTTTRPTSSRHSLLSIGKASKALGIHSATLRQWANDGEFPTIVSPGGTRYFRVEDVQAYLGFDSKDKQEGKEGVPIALVGRVSSSAQAKTKQNATESDLDRQHAKLTEYVTDTYPGANVTDYTSVRSGMNFSDKVFVRLLNDILDGKFDGGYIVCTHRDRVVRFGGEMLSLMCDRGNCELIEIDEQSERGYGEEIAQDILAIVHHFSTKHYGRRSAEATTKRVSDDCLTRMVELRKLNHSIPSVAHTLDQEGYRMGTGKDSATYSEPITEWVIRKWLDSNGNETCLNVAVSLKSGKGAKQTLPKPTTTPIDGFLSQHVELTDSKKDRMRGVQFREAYTAYCTDLGVAPEGAARIGHLLSDRGIKRVRIQGYSYLAGIRLR